MSLTQKSQPNTYTAVNVKMQIFVLLQPMSTFFLTFFKWQFYFSIVDSVLLLSHVQLFVTPWTAACQASLSITNSQNLLKLMSIKLVMPSNHLILCHPLLLPSILPSIRVFSNKSSSSHQVA